MSRLLPLTYWLHGLRSGGHLGLLTWEELQLWAFLGQTKAPAGVRELELGMGWLKNQESQCWDSQSQAAAPTMEMAHQWLLAWASSKSFHLVMASTI